MTRTFSIFDSIRGKIWIATTALAFFVCIFGFVSYLLASFIVNDSLYAVLIPFVLVAVCVVIFGWWLSGEVIAPIEKLSLMAKSLERGVTSSFPNTSGSAETDEVLESLRRIGLQMQKFMRSMEEVSNGNTEGAQIVATDRLSQTFQKLLSRVADSIQAKEQLNKLNEELEKLASQISSAEFSYEPFEIDFDSKRIREIAASFAVTIDEFRHFLEQAKETSMTGYKITAEIRNSLQSLVEESDGQARELIRASKELKKLPEIVQRVSTELSQAMDWVKFSVEQINKRNHTIVESSNVLSLVGKRIRDVFIHVEQMNQQFRQIDKFAKALQDMAHRIDMILLNFSVNEDQTFNEVQSENTSLISEEFHRLARRLEDLSHQVYVLRRALQRELNGMMGLLDSSVQQVTNLTGSIVELRDSIEDLERYATKFLGLQEKTVSYSREQSQKMEGSFQALVKSTIEAEDFTERLRALLLKLSDTFESMRKLQDTVSKFKKFQTHEPEVSKSAFEAYDYDLM
jgi:methyl-accepting chemotaxis protein